MCDVILSKLKFARSSSSRKVWHCCIESFFFLSSKVCRTTLKKKWNGYNAKLSSSMSVMSNWFNFQVGTSITSTWSRSSLPSVRMEIPGTLIIKRWDVALLLPLPLTFWTRKRKTEGFLKLWTKGFLFAATVIWASLCFGHPHSQNPSDMGIPSNPNLNPNR